MAMKHKCDLLLISVDSPIMLGIYENKKLVKSFEREGKFSDSLPNLFSKIFAEYFGGEMNLPDSTNRAHFSSLRGDSTESPKQSTESSLRESATPTEAIHESKDGFFATLTNPLDCHDSAHCAESRNDSVKLPQDEFANIFYANGPGNFSAIKLTHIFLQTLSITKNIPLFCADAFHFSDNEFINAYGKVYFYKKDGEIHTTTLDSKRPNAFSLPNVLNCSIFSADCAPLYILPAV